MATVQPLTPPALDRLVKTCLAKDPDERWQTARDLARELRRVDQETIPSSARTTAFACADGTGCGPRRRWAGCARRDPQAARSSARGSRAFQSHLARRWAIGRSWRWSPVDRNVRGRLTDGSHRERSTLPPEPSGSSGSVSASGSDRSEADLAVLFARWPVVGVLYDHWQWRWHAQEDRSGRGTRP